jgi:hypothetical protein
MSTLFNLINSKTKENNIVFKARDNSGFVVFDSFTGETRFSLTLSEQKLSEADLEAIDC